MLDCEREMLEKGWSISQRMYKRSVAQEAFDDAEAQATSWSSASPPVFLLYVSGLWCAAGYRDLVSNPYNEKQGSEKKIYC